MPSRLAKSLSTSSRVKDRTVVLLGLGGSTAAVGLRRFINEAADSFPRFSDVPQPVRLDDLVLQYPDKPPRYAVAFWPTHVRRRRFYAEPVKFVLKVPACVLGTIVVS